MSKLFTALFLCSVLMLNSCSTYHPVQKQVFGVQSSNGLSEDYEAVISVQNDVSENTNQARFPAKSLVAKLMEPSVDSSKKTERLRQLKVREKPRRVVLPENSHAVASKSPNSVSWLKQGYGTTGIRQNKKAHRKFRKIQRSATNSDLADTFAMISMILGISSVVFFWLPIIGLLLSIAATGLGVWAYFLETRDTQFAMIGGLLGGIGLLLWVIMFIAYRSPFFFF